MSHESHGTGRKIRTFALRLQRPPPYRLAMPVYLCTSPPNPDSPQRTSNSFLRPTGHGLFYLSFCYHYEVHERRNFSCLYERNKRLSGAADGARTRKYRSDDGFNSHSECDKVANSLTAAYQRFICSSTDVLSISHSVSFVKSF